MTQIKVTRITILLVLKVSSRGRARYHGGCHNDFKVDISEFEDQLDSNEFLDCFQTMERVVNYKDIPDEKKAKLVDLMLRKYASN